MTTQPASDWSVYHVPVSVVLAEVPRPCSAAGHTGTSGQGGKRTAGESAGGEGRRGAAARRPASVRCDRPPDWELKLQRRLLSVLRLEIQNQGVGRATLPLGLQGTVLPASPSSRGWLATFTVPRLLEEPPQSLPPLSRGLPPVCLSVSELPLFIRTPVVLGQGPPELLHLDLVPPVKTLSPHEVLFRDAAHQDSDVGIWAHLAQRRWFWVAVFPLHGWGGQVSGR